MAGIAAQLSQWGLHTLRSLNDNGQPLADYEAALEVIDDAIAALKRRHVRPEWPTLLWRRKGKILLVIHEH